MEKRGRRQRDREIGGRESVVCVVFIVLCFVMLCCEWCVVSGVL